MNAHFIDINILFENQSKPCIVSRDKPNIPIMKLEPYEFKVFKSGVYRSQGNNIRFNGKQFWLPNSFMEKLKVQSKRNELDISNLAISMQEFLNPSIIDNFDFKINENIFNSLINTEDDIYIITSKNTQKNYQPLIEKVNELLKEKGLAVKNYYHVSETFYNKNDDDSAFNKAKLVLQHLIGLKTEGKKLTHEEVDNYTQISYYDDSINSIETIKGINNVLENLLINTPEDVKIEVKERLRSNDNIVAVKQYTHNNVQRFDETLVPIEFSNIIRSFENFNL